MFSTSNYHAFLVSVDLTNGVSRVRTPINHERNIIWSFAQPLIFKPNLTKFSFSIFIHFDFTLDPFRSPGCWNKGFVLLVLQLARVVVISWVGSSHGSSSRVNFKTHLKLKFCNCIETETVLSQWVLNLWRLKSKCWELCEWYYSSLVPFSSSVTSR